MVVDFPDPLGPRKPVTRPGLHLEAQIVDGKLLSVPLAQTLGLDHDDAPISAI